MGKMGWKKGDGLGKKMDGIVDCIQITRRDENLGMGAEMETPSAKFKWNDQFWDDTYNQLAQKFSVNAANNAGQSRVNVNDSLDDMLEINSSSDDSDADTSFSSYNGGDLTIQKCSKPLMKIPKLDKSKAIKKDKAEKEKKKKVKK